MERAKDTLVFAGIGNGHELSYVPIPVAGDLSENSHQVFPVEDAYQMDLGIP